MPEGGCAGPCPADHSSDGLALHALLAVMSAGPVATSDAINGTNITSVPHHVIVSPRSEEHESGVGCPCARLCLCLCRR